MRQPYEMHEGYADLTAAVRTQPTQENINALGKWFSRFGGDYWNGEYYDADDLGRVYPIYEEHLDENGDLDYADLVGYELR